MIEILDWLLKIGFGAGLASATTLWATSQKRVHEFRRVQLESELSIFREAIGAFDDAASLTNQFFLNLMTSARNSQDALLSDSTLEPLTAALKHVERARTSCYLAGKVEIGNLIAEYASLLSAVTSAAGTGAVPAPEVLEENARERVAIRNMVMRSLRQEFVDLFH